jgi:hypothetical protein
MRAEIVTGFLEITPQSRTEEYAINKWYEENLKDRCNALLDGRNIAIYPYRKYKRSLRNRVLLWLHNNRIRKMY